MTLQNMRMGVPAIAGHAKRAGRPATGPFYHLVVRFNGLREADVTVGRTPPKVR